ncbi:MAG: hypothetical protein FWF84_06560 [Kiritimatiellaeota bacterium]|nr:hypothetical protein [Kiritimatiellota bacterium]
MKSGNVTRVDSPTLTKQCLVAVFEILDYASIVIGERRLGKSSYRPARFIANKISTIQDYASLLDWDAAKEATMRGKRNMEIHRYLYSHLETLLVADKLILFLPFPQSAPSNAMPLLRGFVMACSDIFNNMFWSCESPMRGVIEYGECQHRANDGKAGGKHKKCDIFTGKPFIDAFRKVSAQQFAGIAVAESVMQGLCGKQGRQTEQALFRTVFAPTAGNPRQKALCVRNLGILNLALIRDAFSKFNTKIPKTIVRNSIRHAKEIS